MMGRQFAREECLFLQRSRKKSIRSGLLVSLKPKDEAALSEVRDRLWSQVCRGVKDAENGRIRLGNFYSRC
jgi:hypothetical protein